MRKSVSRSAMPLNDGSKGRVSQCGAGSLIVVMVLFFILSLVAAYFGRNMIFEQRTSANQYRSTQAFEAAEAGVEWALSMLNGGLVDTLNCASAPVGSGTSFRNRMLVIDQSSGKISVQKYGSPPVTALNAYCVASDAGWSCVCPDTATPSPSWTNLTNATSSGPKPAFRVSFPATVSRPGVIQLQSQGCNRLDTTCLATNNGTFGSEGDGRSWINVWVAIKGGISAAPFAALTVGGQVNVTGSGTTTVVNSVPSTNGVAVTVNARSSVSFSNAIQVSLRTSYPALNASSCPTSTGQPLVACDTGLPSSPDRMFTSVFGMRRDAYRLQPAAITLNCADASNPCTAAALSTLAAKNPGRVLWLNGDAALNNSDVGNVDIGSAAAPVAVVAHGQLTKAVGSGPVRIFGLVYQYDASGAWTTAGDLYIQGATVVEGDMLGTGSPTLIYDLSILNFLRLSGGSFVRVPGGWIDN